MKKIVIPGTDIEVSKFIFGTASLLSAGSSLTRNRLLHAAVEHGFTHFDVAPYYGFGIAERDLAPVLKAHPQVTVTTKVGLYSPGGENQSSLSVLIRKAGGKIIKSLSRPRSTFDLKRAQLSLEGSLRRLGRECIDLYLLHEPQYEHVETQAWMEWLQSRQRAGQIRAFGIAMFAHQVTPFLNSNSPLAQVIQISDSVNKHEADIVLQHQRPLQITFGYIAAAQTANDSTPAKKLLQAAMECNQTGAIIIGTKRIERLALYRDL